MVATENIFSASTSSLDLLIHAMWKFNTLSVLSISVLIFMSVTFSKVLTHPWHILSSNKPRWRCGICGKRNKFSCLFMDVAAVIALTSPIKHALSIFTSSLHPLYFYLYLFDYPFPNISQVLLTFQISKFFHSTSRTF